MVKLNLGVSKLLLAVLATIVITPDDSHHRCEVQVPPSNAPLLLSLRHRFSRKKYRANMSEDVALGFRKPLRNRVRIVFGYELIHLPLKPRAPHRLQRRPSVILTGR